MSRKHYVKVARAFHQLYLNATSDEMRKQILATAEEVAIVFKQDRGEFDLPRFLRAVKEGTA